jgi:hypothetical protein
VRQLRCKELYLLFVPLLFGTGCGLAVRPTPAADA